MIRLLPDRMTLADTARDEGEFAKAARLYAKVGRRDTRYFAALVQRANILKDLGEFSAAQAAYLAAWAINSNDPDLSMQLGHLHKLMGENAEALGHYDRAARLGEEPRTAMLEAARLRLRAIDPQIAVDVNGDFRVLVPEILASRPVRAHIAALVRNGSAAVETTSDVAAFQAARALILAAGCLPAEAVKGFGDALDWREAFQVLAAVPAVRAALDAGWFGWSELLGVGASPAPALALAQGGAEEPPVASTPQQRVTDGSWTIKGRWIEGWVICAASGATEICAWIDGRPSDAITVAVAADQLKKFTFPIQNVYVDGQARKVEVVAARDRERPLRCGADAASLVFQRRIVHSIDEVENGFITGWAFDALDPAAPLEIELYDGPALINRTDTPIRRSDVNRLFGIDGSHGFVMPIPVRQFDGTSHQLILRAEGEELTIDPSRQPQCLTPALITDSAERFAGRVEHLDCKVVSGWAVDRLDPLKPQHVSIFVDGICQATVVADKFQKRLQSVGGGYSLFHYEFPLHVMNGGRRKVEVRFGPDARLMDLDGKRNKSAEVCFPLIDFFGSFDPRDGSGAFAPLPPFDLMATPAPAAPRQASACDEIDVSLIVLNWNAAPILEKFLESVVVQLAGNRIELILVDHGSEDDSLAVAERFADRLPINVIARQANYSFSNSNNLAARQARGRHLFFVNNDLVFVHDCLPVMTAWLDNDPSVCLVGMRLVEPLPDNNGGWRYAPHHRGIQFAPLNKGGELVYNARELDDTYAEFTGAYEMPAVTGAAFLCRKTEFFEIGGFEESYFYGLEDVDLSLRLRSTLKKRIVCEASATAIHNRSYTRSARIRTSVANPIVTNPKSQTDNAAVFLRRFKRKVTRETLSSLLDSKTLWRLRPLRVAFAVTEASYTAAAGDFFTAMELAEAMRSAFGWETVFVKNDVTELPGVDVVIAMRHDYPLRKVTDANPGLITVAWMRNRIDEWIAQPEFDAYGVLFCSSNLAIRTILEQTGRKAHLLPIATNADRFKPLPLAPEHETDIVFTGNFWGFERDAIQLLDADLPGRLSIYGYGWQKNPRWRSRWRGALPYRELPAAYSSAKMVIDDSHPVTKDWNSLNSRIFDSIGSGALVMTNNTGGAEELFGGLLPTFTNGQELRALITGFLRSPAKREKLARQLREHVLAHHTYKHRAQSFKQVVQGFVGSVTRFAIKVGVPRPEEKHAWGDWHFAVGLQRALRRAGHEARIDILPEWNTGLSVSDDVVIVLRGLSAYEPKASQVNLLWLISHPDDVSISELEKYDHVFVASTSYARDLQRRLPDRVSPLLQCTDPNLFRAEVDPALEVPDVLFVGNSRGVRRKVVDDAIDSGLGVGVYGAMWESLIPKAHIRGAYLANDGLRRHYAGAKVLLNDHWPDMKREGFISNRIFDAGACGAAVVSDDVVGLGELFGDAVVTYADRADLKQKVDALLADEADRKARGERLRDRVLEAHTFDHRVREILAVVAPFTCGMGR